MRSLIAIVGFVLCIEAGNTQTIETTFMVRNYSSTLMIALSEEDFSLFVLGEYGEDQISTDQDIEYKYQAQEYDDEIKLYYFPSRIYSPKLRRFYNPDPQSQYFSPYLFVAADPVNNVDRDGNIGKPIILHGLETRPSTESVDIASAVDMQEVVDGYYFPISDFVNGGFSKHMPEWNGNVFINGHTTVEGNIVAEQYSGSEVFRLKPAFAESYPKFTHGMRGVNVKPSAIGNRLAEVSRREGVSIKRVVVSGCHGSIASERLVGATAVAAERRGLPNRIRGYGLKKGKIGNFTSPATRADFNRQYPELAKSVKTPPPKHPFYYVTDEGENEVNFLEKDEYTRDYFSGRTGESFPTVQPHEMNRFVNGRMPQTVGAEFERSEAQLTKL